MVGKRDEIHSETDEARGGSTPHIVRWILGISLVAAILALSAIWMFGAASVDNPSGQAAVTASAVRGEATGTTTDGIVSDGADELATGDTANAGGEPLAQPDE